ncbi:MAG: hypothetical protein ABEI06_09240 [Halobacteriaceae archaeon]
MVQSQRISMTTTGHEADETLIREYIVPNLERLQNIEGCDGVRYSRFGMDPRWEKSEVKLAIYGDYEQVIATEQERWNELQTNGYIESWHRDGTPFADYPEPIQEFLRDAYILASEMSQAYFEKFDEQPALTEEYTTEEGRSYGLWVLIHVLLNQLGYTAEAEADAYIRLLQDRLVALSQLHGYEHTRTLIDDYEQELTDVEHKLDELEQAGGFDYYTGPEN